jgi:hypothetical protein
VDCFRSTKHLAEFYFSSGADHDFFRAIHRAASNQNAAFPFMGSSGIRMQRKNETRSRDLAMKAPARGTSRRFKMSSMLRKVAIAAVAALTFGASVTATVTPSMAQGWHGHGWHRGWGWHGGYWGGGWGWHGGYWGGGGPVAAGILGGLALGALAGSAYAYGPAFYGRCYWQDQVAYDAWGNFAGYQPVQVCY